jgi:hypothetical protein
MYKDSQKVLQENKQWRPTKEKEEKRKKPKPEEHERMPHSLSTAPFCKALR